MVRVGVRIGRKVKWDQLAAILNDGYLMSAPHKVRKKPARLNAAAASTGALEKRTSRLERQKKTPGPGPLRGGVEGLHRH